MGFWKKIFGGGSDAEQPKQEETSAVETVEEKPAAPAESPAAEAAPAAEATWRCTLSLTVLSQNTDGTPDCFTVSIKRAMRFGVAWLSALTGQR